MATIHTLHKSISQMAFEEALALIHRIRASRSVAKKTTKPKTTVTRTAKTPRKKTNPMDLITALPQNDKEQLIAMLKGEL